MNERWDAYHRALAEGLVTKRLLERGLSRPQWKVYQGGLEERP